jgi:cell division protein FtsL
MIRFISFVGAVLLIASSVGLYKLKYGVQRLDRQARTLQASIDQERQNIQVLEAEWTYLNQPQRIQNLADRFLQLKPVQPGQLAAIEQIPLKGAQPAEPPRVAGRAVPRSGGHSTATAARGVIAPTLATIRAPAIEDDR